MCSRQKKITIPFSFLLQLALVEETIAYITYLESILSTSNEQVGNASSNVMEGGVLATRPTYLA